DQVFDDDGVGGGAGGAPGAIASDLLGIDRIEPNLCSRLDQALQWSFHRIILPQKGEVPYQHCTKEVALRCNIPGLLAVASCLILWIVAGGSGGQAAFSKKAHVFKTVDGVKVHADVYRSAGSKARPVLVWIHGGALIVGDRTGLPKNL